MTQVVKIEDGKQRSLVEKFAATYTLDPKRVLPILKATAFKTRNGEPSNEQMAALLVVADQYGLNPFTKEIYAFPDKQNGIVPVVGVDGWSRIINGRKEFNGMDFEYSDSIVTDDEHKPCPEWVRCIIHRKDQSHPIAVTEYFDECYRTPFKTNSGSVVKGPWQTHTKRMLRHKAMIQAARIAFGFVGIFDPDEADRIVEGVVIDAAPAEESTADLNEELGLNGDDE